MNKWNGAGMIPLTDCWKERIISALFFCLQKIDAGISSSKELGQIESIVMIDFVWFFLYINII